MTARKTSLVFETGLTSAQGPPINTETALLAGFTNALRVSDQIISRSGDLQPGTRGDFSLHSVSIGTGFEFGDTLRYDVTLGYRLWPAIYETYPSPQINLFLELNGLWEQRSRDFRSDGSKIHDSGGNRIFLSPGIQYIPGRAFLIEASVQIPLVENLNGDQLKTDLQCPPFVFGKSIIICSILSMDLLLRTSWGGAGCAQWTL